MIVCLLPCKVHENTTHRDGNPTLAYSPYREGVYTQSEEIMT